MVGQLMKNRETGRFGVVKKMLNSGKAVVTRCNAHGLPAADKFKTLWGTSNGPGIWITLLSKWEPVATHQQPAGQMSLFT